MSQDNWPKPKGWVPRRGVYLIQDSDTRFPALDRDAALASRPIPKRVRRRIVVDERQTYTAYDAHSLLEHEDYSHRARPGHPLG